MSQTTFLISNLHCPSCVTNIENALYALEPRPYSISHSIVSHTVTVNHQPQLSIKALSRALEDEGYEIYSTVGDPEASQCDGDIGDSHVENNASSSNHGLETWSQALQRWAYGGKSNQEGDRKRKRHMENCEQCRAQEKLAESEDGVQEPTDKDLFTVVPTTSSMKHFSATIAIDGMSCSSCVEKISNGIKEGNPWVESVDVNLLSHSAVVKFIGEDKTDKLVSIIGDIGYDASIQQIEEIDQSGPLPKDDIWKATYSIVGMTCSSCVGGVTNALENLSWTRNVDVNLIANSATVVFEGKDHLKDILTTIEDLGYDAKLTDVVDLSSDALKETRRTVSIRVDGMYCEHCPGRVASAIQALGEQVVVEKQLTVKDSVMRVNYLPDVPHLTIRKILAAISAADDAFIPSIYHPLSIEERSQMMQAREQRHILFRVILSIIVAIPTLIIGIVYMTLVPSHDPNRQYLMQTLRGVSRANWALLVLATPVYFFAGDIFHRRTLKELRALWRPGSRTPIARRFYRFGTMNMLVSLGTSIAYFASIAELIVAATKNPDHETPSYFDSVVFLTMFLLIGRWIEAYSKAKTGDAVAMLGKLRPTEAILVSKDDSNGSPDNDSETSNNKVNVDLLEFGDVIRVLHGGSPACDGTVIEGDSTFDESSLTGESKPVTKSIGDEVYSGTVNQGGAVSVRVNGVAGASMLDQIMEVVREGQTRRAPVERVADAITGYFVPLVTLMAIVTWLVWLILGLSDSLPTGYRDTDVGGWAFWSLQFAIAVFVIACPCGIGLAAPTALFVGGGLAANHGILVKGGGEAFQEASKLDCIVFDKTGTLTQGGEPVITDHQLFSQPKNGVPTDEKIILGAVKKLEEDSSHPIAKAVVDFCDTKGVARVEGKETKEVAGKGMKGSFETEELPGKIIEVLIGNEALMTEYDAHIPSTERATLDSWKREAKSIVLVAMRILPEPDGKSPEPTTAWSIFAIFAVSDPLRPEAQGVVRSLQDRGVDVWMISGDNPLTAFAVGNKVGITQENIIAGVLPEQKADKIKELQRSLKKKRRTRTNIFANNSSQATAKTTVTNERAIIAMVGDGINDSPALTTADVGIAIGSGSDIAISTAKFVLITSNLTSLLTLIDLSRVVFRRIKFNFGWALVYNLIALPVAAGVLYPLKSNGVHIRLDPVWAALAMALSSTSVVCSSLLLRSKLPLVGFRDQKKDLGD